MKTGEKVFSESHPFLANCFRNKGRCLSRMVIETLYEHIQKIGLANTGNLLGSLRGGIYVLRESFGDKYDQR